MYNIHDINQRPYSRDIILKKISILQHDPAVVVTEDNPRFISNVLINRYGTIV